MPIVPPNWAGSYERSVTAAKTSPDVARARMKDIIEGRASIESLDVMAILEFFEAISANPKAFLDSLASGGGVLIDKLVELVSGFDIPSGTVETSLRGGATEATRLALGNIFVKLLDSTLKLDGVRAGFLSRETGAEEAVNMARMVGAAFRLQIGDMLADWVGKALPFNLGTAFTQIAERIDKAINLDDAIEEIIQVPMEAVITRGLTQFYNRQLLPVDFTDQQAIQAMIGYGLPRETVDKILDNSGIRKDIRETLIKMTASNLTESDINEAYQRNLLSIEQVSEQYKEKYFQEPERKIKTDLVKGTRRWQLQTKVVELLGNLYRDGVETRDSCKPYLDHLGFENDEQDLWFLQQELERKQRKWLSDSNLLKLVKTGVYSIAEATEYMVMQGVTVSDASKFLTLAIKEEVEAEVASIEREVKAVVNKLPKAVRDQCDDVFSPEKILSELLTRAIALIPLGGANLTGLADLRKIIECALKGLGVQVP